MLEVLVAIAIFAFGAIGATGMQLLATQANYEAMQRSRAVDLATDIIERMRNNPTALDSYDSSLDTSWEIVGSDSIEDAPTTNCVTSTCTPTALAAYDLWAWEQALDGNDVTRTEVAVGGLNKATGCIRYTGDGRIELAIAWYGRRSKSNSTLATGCTVDGRYDNADEYRRVLHLRTVIPPPST